MKNRNTAKARMKDRIERQEGTKGRNDSKERQEGKQKRNAKRKNMM